MTKKKDAQIEKLINYIYVLSEARSYGIAGWDSHIPRAASIWINFATGKKDMIIDHIDNLTAQMQEKLRERFNQHKSEEK